MRSRRSHLLPPLALALAALALAGCGRSGPAPVGSAGPGKPRFEVVAAESFWGSLAAQLAGDRATVTSVIVNPETDPHSYQPTAQDARTFSDAAVAIVNGLGYDSWAGQLLDASPSSRRVVLDVARTLGLPSGANPHRWYYPHDVHAIVRAIAAAYERVDPADRAYFAERLRYVQSRALARYDELIARIRARYAGVSVGYSESIFAGLGHALGLRLATPASFARAVAEGTDVTAGERRAVDAAIEARRIAVWVFNSQNVTPDVQRANGLARAGRIPVATVTETLAPPGATFQAWQVAQLEGLARALRAGTGR